MYIFLIKNTNLNKKSNFNKVITKSQSVPITMKRNHKKGTYDGYKIYSIAASET